MRFPVLTPVFRFALLLLLLSACTGPKTPLNNQNTEIPFGPDANESGQLSPTIASIDASSAVVEWDTVMPGSSMVTLSVVEAIAGGTPLYLNTTEDKNPVSHHSVRLQNLQSNTAYRFKVTSNMDGIGIKVGEVIGTTSAASVNEFAAFKRFADPYPRSPIYNTAGTILRMGVASPSANRVDRFYLAPRPDDANCISSYHQFEVTEADGKVTMSGLTDLGGCFVPDSKPAATSWAGDRLDVFARGGDNCLYQNYYQGNWSGWVKRTCGVYSSPAVTSWAPNRLDVFFAGTPEDGYPMRHYAFHTSTGWAAGVNNLGGTMTGPIAAASWAENRLDMIHRGTDGNLYHNSWTGTGWSTYASLGPANGIPALVSRSAGTLDLYVRGTGNVLMYRPFNASNGGWGAWQNLGGRVAEDGITVTRYNSNKVRGYFLSNPLPNLPWDLLGFGRK